MSARTWSAITGTIATTNSASAASTATITVRTAYERRMPRRSKNSTDGLRPAARNSATTTSISVEPIAWICSAEPQRDQEAEAADEADVERRAVVERRPGLAEVVVDRLTVGRSSGSVGLLLGAAPGRRSLVVLVLGEPGDDVAQRGELRGDRVAALGHPVDLGA